MKKSNGRIQFGMSGFGSKKKTTPITYSNETPDIERDSIEELTALQAAFRDKGKKEQELQTANTDGDFWSCIIFKTQDERDEFYRLLDINSDDLQYINGRKLIKALEMQINLPDISAPKKFRVNKEISELSVKL